MITSAKTSLLRARAAGFGLGLALLASPALADSISPTTFSDTIGVGETTSVNKTVTVSAGAPTTAQADIFFLSDTTGSMGSVISSVQTNASTILTNSSGFGNVQWGVGQYRDLGDSPVSQVQQTITSTQSAVTTAIGNWSASGGGDTPENGFQGLIDAANGGGWRAGSQKFIVMFGDAPFHDGAVEGNPSYPSQANAVTALNNQGIHVIAVNSGNLDGAGQATALASATGGSLVSLGSDVASLIQSQLTTAFATYSNVTLDLSEVPAGLLASIVPVNYNGSFTREDEENYAFLLSFKGLIPGVYDFSVYGLVDGGRVAEEVEHIVVTGPSEVPLPGTAVLMASALLGIGGVLRRHKRKKSA